MILVIVGLQGSGKGKVAEILKEDGFVVIELGDIWRELIDKAGIPREDTRATREFTMQLRVKYGKDIYAKYAIERITNDMKKVAIVGVRSTYELDYLRSCRKDLALIAVKAPLKLRFERMEKRGKPEDPKNIADFKWLEKRNKQGFMADKKEGEHGLVEVIKLADYSITNTGTVEELKKRIDRIIAKVED